MTDAEPEGELPLDPDIEVEEVAGVAARPLHLRWTAIALVRRGEDHGGRRAIRLFAGTGVLGGFTTYSTFALDTDGLLQAAQVGGSVLYAFATVLVGAAASVAGIALGAALHRSRVRSV